MLLLYVFISIYMYTCNTQRERERERKKNNMLNYSNSRFCTFEVSLSLSTCLVLERLEARISLHPDARPLDFAPLVLCGLGGLSAGQSPMPNSRSSCYIISGPKNAHKHTTIHLPILDTQQRWQFFAGHCIPVMCRLTTYPIYPRLTTYPVKGYIRYVMLRHSAPPFAQPFAQDGNLVVESNWRNHGQSRRCVTHCGRCFF